MRNRKIEMLRCICIFLVIYIHNASEVESVKLLTTPEWFSNLIYLISGIIGRIAVPVMFLISGYLMARKRVVIIENIIKKTRSILIPYILWNIIWIIIYACAIKVGVLNGTGKNVWEYSLLEWIDCFTGHLTGAPFVYPLWFLRDLFLLQCIFPLFQNLYSKKIWTVGVFIIAILYCLSYPVEQIFMFMLGIWISYHQNLKLCHQKMISGGVVVIFTIFIVLELKYIGIRQYIRPISVLMGMYVLYLFVNVIETKKYSELLIKIAPYTMFIYCGHQYLLLFFRHLCSSVFNQNIVIRTIEYIFIPYILFAFLFVVGYLLNKKLRKLYKVLSGGR